MYKHEEYFCVNTQTGELLLYESIPYKRDISGIICKHFTLASDEEELFEIVKRYGEKRLSDICYNLDRDILGDRYLKVLTMCSLISYFNIGFYKRDELASLLEIKVSSLNKALNKMVDLGLFVYSSKRCKQGYIRLVWNPILVWKGWNTTTRVMEVERWLNSSKLSSISNTSMVLSSDDVSIPEPIYRLEDENYLLDPYVRELYPDTSRIELLDISDIEFELYLLNPPKLPLKNSI